MCFFDPKVDQKEDENQNTIVINAVSDSDDENEKS